MRGRIRKIGLGVVALFCWILPFSISQGAMTVKGIYGIFPEKYVSISAPVGLSSSDFSIKEIRDGVSSFSPIDLFEFSDPEISVIILIDVSINMTDSDIDYAKSAALTIIDQLKTDDRVAVLRFAGLNQDLLVVPFTTSKSYAKDQINLLSKEYGRYGTDLSGAIYRGFDEIDFDWSSRRDYGMVIISNGFNDDSGYTTDSAVYKINNAKASSYLNFKDVYALFTGDSANYSSNDLYYIANNTGSYYSSGTSGFSGFYDTIYNSLMADYKLYYTPTDFTALGETRTVEVAKGLETASGTYNEPLSSPIFVHGICEAGDTDSQLNATEVYWGTPFINTILQGPLLNSSYVSYRDATQSLKDQAKELVNTIITENAPIDQATYIAHSMGGLVLRYILNAQYSNPDNLEPEIIDQMRTIVSKMNRIITLATPHYGSPSAESNVSEAFQALCDVVGLGEDLTPCWTAVQDLKESQWESWNDAGQFVSNDIQFQSNGIARTRTLPVTAFGGRSYSSGQGWKGVNFGLYVTDKATDFGAPPDPQWDRCFGPYCGVGTEWSNDEIDNDGVVSVLSGMGIKKDGVTSIGTNWARYDGVWNHFDAKRSTDSAEWVRDWYFGVVRNPPMKTTPWFPTGIEDFFAGYINAPLHLSGNQWVNDNLYVDAWHDDPQGYTTASRLVHDDNSDDGYLMAQVGTDIPEGENLLFSVWLRSDTPQTVALSFVQSSEDLIVAAADPWYSFVKSAWAANFVSYTEVNVTDQWQEFTLTGTFPSVTATSGVAIGGNGTFVQPNGSLDVWFPSLVDECDSEYSGLPDADGDGVADVCDICPDNVDPGQEDCDGDGIGDVCDDTPCDYLFNLYDTDQDWVIGDFELLDAIDGWAAGNLGDFELLDLIDFWAAGCYQWDPSLAQYRPGCA